MLRHLGEATLCIAGSVLLLLVACTGQKPRDRETSAPRSFKPDIAAAASSDDVLLRSVGIAPATVRERIRQSAP